MEGNRVRQICNRSFSNGKAMGGHMRSHCAKILLHSHISTPSSSSSPLHPHTISPRLTPHTSPDRPLSFVEDSGHKKVKLQRKKDEVLEVGGGDNYCSAGNGNGNNDDGCSHKIFECPYCGKVFESGQALGGHKKVHFQLSGDSPNCSAAASSSKCKVTGKLRRSSLIDLNQLPDPETNNEESKPFHCMERRIF